MNWVSVLPNNASEFNALELAGALNIPEGHHLLIEHLIIATKNLDGYTIRWDGSFTDEPSISNKFNRNSIRFTVDVANEQALHYKDLGIHVFAGLDLRDFTGGTVSVSIGYEFALGSMRFDFSYLDLIANYRIIGVILTSAGGEFHKTGDFKRLGVEN